MPVKLNLQERRCRNRDQHAGNPAQYAASQQGRDHQQRMDIDIVREKLGIDDISVDKHDHCNDHQSDDHLDIRSRCQTCDNCRAIAQDRSEIRDQVAQSDADSDDHGVGNAGNGKRYSRQHADNARIHHLPPDISRECIVRIFNKCLETVFLLVSENEPERAPPVRDNAALLIQQKIDRKNDAEQ